jgi:hypothetical protein
VPGKTTYPVPVPISATAVRSVGIDDRKHKLTHHSVWLEDVAKVLPNKSVHLHGFDISSEHEVVSATVLCWEWVQCIMDA